MFNWFKKKVGLIDDNLEQNYDKDAEELSEVGVEETITDADIDYVDDVVDTVASESTNEILVDTISETTNEIVDEIREEVVVGASEPETGKKSLWQKLINGLDKTRKEVVYKFEQVLGAYDEITDELFEELEEILITADIGIDTTMLLIDRLKVTVKEQKVTKPEEVRELLHKEMLKLISDKTFDCSLNIEPSPAVILIVGVNGVGKTTTIGKLTNNLKKSGKSVLIAAGDTFRAAAIEQLEEWANRSGVDCISHSEGSDPAAVIFDGIQAAKARNVDVLICDTAGRLHNKANLMNELNKIFRVLDKEFSEAKREVLLVLDATTGQNAMIQAKTFAEAVPLTGIALTKLDGTAKGGVVLALQHELDIPVKLVGVGEGIDDLQEFIPEAFIDAIFK